MKVAQHRTLVRKKSIAGQPRKLPWYILALIIFQAFAAFLTETRFLPLKHNVGAFEVGSVVFFIIVAGYFAQHKVPLRFHRSLLPLFLLTIAAGLSNFNIMSDPSAYVVFRVLSCTILVISCLMLVVWYNVFIFDESTLELFLRAITFSAAIITVWVLLDQIAHGGTIGASGPFRNRAHSGIYLHTALWLVLIRANWPKGVRWDRWLTYPVVAMILYVISTSGRRSIYISIGCGFILLAVVTLFTGSARARFRIGALMLVSVGALGIVYFKLSDFWRPAEFFVERVSMVDDRISTFSGLEEESEDTFVIQQRMAGIRAFKEHPILGIGYGGFAKYDGNPTGHEMHSTPTRFLAETGMVGLGLYLWWMGEIFLMGFRVWWGNRKGPFGSVCLIMLVALTAVSISSIYNRQMTDRSFWLLLVFCIGMEAWSRRNAMPNRQREFLAGESSIQWERGQLVEFRLDSLSRQVAEEIVLSLIDIDKDTIGERWDRSHFLHEMPGKWECSWIVVGQDGPAGFVIASEKPDSVHVHRIAVAGYVRGKGLGQLLLERVADSASRRRISRITLRVAAENVGAVRFYSRLGFAPTDPAARLLDLSISTTKLIESLRSRSTTRMRGKVLFVCAADISAAKLLAPQVQALERAGFEVHIACSGGAYAQQLQGQGFQIQVLDISNRASPVNNLATILQLYRLMRRENYMIVHVHMISAAFLGRLAAKLAGVPLVLYTFRGFAFYEGSSRKLKWFNLAIEKACRPFTNFYFCQSNENLRRAINHGVIPEGRNMLLGNGIALESFTQRLETDDRVEIRRQLGIDLDASVVGFVGRLVREKGLFELVEAAVEIVERVKGALFVIVGDALPSDAGSRDELQALIRKSGLESQFRFVGWRPDVERLYQAMDVFVLPSYREGMPRSIMEAMASSKPVVATDIPGCRDQVVNGVTGLLVPLHDPSALANAIINLLNDAELAKSMGTAGMRKAIQEFDERAVCNRLVAQYEKLVDNEEHSIEELPYERKRWSRLGKVVMDYSAALVALIILLPLFLLIAVGIKIDSRGPVFFRQIREGRHRRPFRIIKFRTMAKDAESHGLEIQKDDARITRVGRLLRLMSLDELPQLVNVLRGEMSLVGPRPLLPGTTRESEERRLSMRPGITSYPALFGRHALQWEERMPIDLWYVDRWSLGLDIRILLHTVPIVLAAKNIYDSEGGSRMRSESGIVTNGVLDRRS